MIDIVIGLDVHKHSVYATVLNDNGELVIQRNTENNISVLDSFLNDYKEHDIVIESSTSGKYLSKALMKLNYKIHLINPDKISAIDGFKKTDREDSYKLAYLYRINALKEIYIPSEEIENIRTLVRYRHSLGEEITVKKNQIHAILASYGIIIKAADPFGKKGLREISNNYNKLNSSDRIVLRSLLSDISGIKSREKEIETELSNIAVNNNNIKLLMTIPGINYYSACGIYSEIGDISRFKNKERFASYTGLIPKEYSSGEKVVKGHITKHGPSILRFFLTEISHIIIKYTKKFRTKYLSIVRRLGKKRSIIAIARILAETIFTMLKNNTGYI
ncbi:IS110 family transposase, partial [Acidiplasma aeolicum]